MYLNPRVFQVLFSDSLLDPAGGAVSEQLRGTWLMAGLNHDNKGVITAALAQSKNAPSVKQVKLMKTLYKLRLYTPVNFN